MNQTSSQLAAFPAILIHVLPFQAFPPHIPIIPSTHYYYYYSFHTLLLLLLLLLLFIYLFHLIIIIIIIIIPPALKSRAPEIHHLPEQPCGQL